MPAVYNLSKHASEGGKARWAAYHALKATLELNHANQTAKPADTFRDMTLFRVRKQMHQVQSKLEKLLSSAEFDSKQFKELTEAFSRLEIAEQKLSGRAAPGSLRPSTRSKRERGSRAKPEVE